LATAHSRAREHTLELRPGIASLAGDAFEWIGGSRVDGESGPSDGLAVPSKAAT